MLHIDDLNSSMCLFLASISNSSIEKNEVTKEDMKDDDDVDYTPDDDEDGEEGMSVTRNITI